VSFLPDDLLRILETSGQQLHALLTRLTLRADVAEDLLQELFLKLRGSDGFRRATNPGAYAVRTAIHLAADWRRANRAARHGATLHTDPVVMPVSPLQRLIDAEDLERVLDALFEIPESSRAVLVLHYVQHQDYEDIARQLGKTEHQVRGLCSKGVRRLRVLLKAVSESPDAGRTSS
jgi:RNA polymerase sigma factor (sigma-70 family)